MKIIFQNDDGTVMKNDDGTDVIFDRVTDAYIAVRSLQDIATKKKVLGVEVKVKSHSFGNNIRDLVKEIHQSEIELQDLLTNQRNGYKQTDP